MKKKTQTPTGDARFSKETLRFLTRASRQKSRNWLETHHEEYESLLLSPLKRLAETARRELRSVAAGYHFPQKGIGRLKRSSDRAKKYGSLYKDWVAYSASRPSESRFDHNPNLFFLIHPEDQDDPILVAGGLYMPSSRQLRAVREAIAADASPFDRLFATKEFKARFKGGFSKERSSSRPPRGFDPEHARMDWLKLQAFFVWKPYTLREFSSPRFPEIVARDWRQIVRLNELLENAVSGRWARASRHAAPGKPGGSGKLSERLEEFEAPRVPADF